MVKLKRFIYKYHFFFFYLCERYYIPVNPISRRNGSCNELSHLNHLQGAAPGCGTVQIKSFRKKLMRPVTSNRVLSRISADLSPGYFQIPPSTRFLLIPGSLPYRVRVSPWQRCGLVYGRGGAWGRNLIIGILKRGFCDAVRKRTFSRLRVRLHLDSDSTPPLLVLVSAWSRTQPRFPLHQSWVPPEDSFISEYAMNHIKDTETGRNLRPHT